MGIPSLWQPPVTHCAGACLGRRRRREGKVHGVLKKLLSLPLSTFFDTPCTVPTGECCANLPGLYPTSSCHFEGCAPVWLFPGMQGASQDAFKYCIIIWSQGSAFEWKTQVSLKELGIWLISKSFCAALLFTLSCPLFSSALNWKLDSCFPQEFCYSAQRCVLPSDESSLCDYPQEEKHRTQERKECCKGQLTNDFSEAEWCVILAESPLKRKCCS